MLPSLTAIFLIRRKIACDCGRWALYGLVSSVLDAAREALPSRHHNPHATNSSYHFFNHFKDIELIVELFMEVQTKEDSKMLRSYNYLFFIFLLIFSANFISSPSIGIQKMPVASRPQISVNTRTTLSKSKIIRVSVIVNEDHYTIPRSDIDATIGFASDSLFEKTRTFYVIKDVYYSRFGRSQLYDVVQNYLYDHLSDLPDYVVVFAKTDTILYGGYTIIPPFGGRTEELNALLEEERPFCSNIASPYLPPGVVYVAELDWHHLLGRCGYDYSVKRGEWVHVSNVSFGGQCRNQPGLKCIFRYDEWQCPNLLDDPDVEPQIRDRRLFTADSINHELLHNFGYKGVDDHLCGDEVPEAVKNESAFDICGSNIETFKRSGLGCVSERRSIGEYCSRNCMTGTYCYEFRDEHGSVTTFQCSHPCESESDCSPLLGKTVQCRLRALDDPLINKACFYH